MTLVAMSVGLSLLLLWLAFKAAFAQTAAVKVLDWNFHELEAVIETFSTLTARSEDAYLMQALGRDDYKRCRRARALLARKCLKHIKASASLAMAVALPDEHGEIRSAQSELSKAAANVHVASAFASTYLFLVWLFPRWIGPLPSRAASYRTFLGRVRFLEEREQRV